MLLDRRRSGVLLHPTSLPSRHGIGDLGSAAFEFLDYLAGARQSLWQVLPLSPTGYGDSPYASPSAFAGNPLLISLERLVEEGLLAASDIAELESLPTDQVDFARLVPLKQRALQQAFERFKGRDDLRGRMREFADQHAAWLHDFALFSALHEAFQSEWTHWPVPLRGREPDALQQARAEHAERVEYFVFCQFVFAEQWAAVRRRANNLGIAVIGDIPIFVAHDSADVWANPRLFKLDDQGRPRVVAGVPPDYFSATGQLWGNPLYDWGAMAHDGYAWWIARFRHLFELVDLVRIDHFRAFQAAWEIPADASTAIEGTWVPGPRLAVFEAVAEALGGSVPVIAEDLGLITDDVRELLGESGFPGMKVLQFAFGGGTDNLYLPHNYPDPNCVVYTGTHDNDTTRGWWEAASAEERQAAQHYLGRDGSDVVYDMIRLAHMSIARTAILPLQDVLSLGSEARMNTPGAVHGNWAWRVRPGQMDHACAERLAHLTVTYGREPSP